MHRVVAPAVLARLGAELFVHRGDTDDEREVRGHVTPFQRRRSRAR